MRKKDKIFTKENFKKVKRRVISIVNNESTGGILLLICTVIAVALATFPVTRGFDAFWDKELGFVFESKTLTMSLRSWVNNGLMAIFFFTVGLEIKREMLVGQLSSFKKSILPVMAALGGMIVPALIYAGFNWNNPETIHGWGIPMATDIAFALGVLSIMGKRVPVSLKVFLTALAIIDDLGAIIVLAIFYPSHDIHTTYLIYVVLILAILIIMNKIKVRHSIYYIIPGVIMWYFMYKSGINATISGVLLAMAIPSKGITRDRAFSVQLESLLHKFKESEGIEYDIKQSLPKDMPVSTWEGHVLANAEQQHLISSMNREIGRVTPLMHQFEVRLQPIVNFIIMPLFALTNAGVALDFSSFATGGIPTIALGIFFGLLLGKPIGIFLFSYISIKLGFAAKPAGVNKRQLFAVAFFGGIGFTMCIFINGLAFSNPALVDMGKISILLTSTAASIAGILAIHLTCKK